MPASDNKNMLNEMETAILSSLLAVGIRSPQAIHELLSKQYELVGLSEEINEAQIKKHLTQLVEKGYINQKTTPKGEIYVFTTFGSSFVQKILIELSNDIDQINSKTSDSLLKLVKQIRNGCTDINKQISGTWDEITSFIAAFVTQTRDQVVNSQEIIFPLLELNGEQKKDNNETENTKTIISGNLTTIKTQIGESIHSLESTLKKVTDQEQSENNSYKLRFTEIKEDYTKIRMDLNKQIQKLTNQAKKLSEIDSTLGSLGKSLEEKSIQGISTYKADIENIVAEYADAAITLEMSTENPLQDPITKTLSTVDKANITTMISLDSISSEMQEYFKTLEDKHSLILNLVNHLLEAQQELNKAPANDMENQNEIKAFIKQTMEIARTNLDEVLQPTTIAIKNTFNEITTQTQDKVKELETFQQDLVEKREVVNSVLVDKPSLLNLKEKIQQVLSDTLNQMMKSRRIKTTEGALPVSEILHTVVTSVQAFLENVSVDIHGFTNTIVDPYLNESNKLSKILESTISSNLRNNEADLTHFTEIINNIGEQIKNELLDTIKTMERTTEQSLIQINSDVSTTLKQEDQDIFHKLDKIVGIQKGVLTIYSKGLKSAIERYNEYTNENLNELKTQLENSGQQLISEIDQTLSGIDIEAFLQFLEDNVKQVLSELSEQFISRIKNDLVRTRDNITKIAQSTENTVATSSQSLLATSTLMTDQTESHIAEVIDTIQEVKGISIDTIGANLLALRDEFAELSLKTRAMLEERSENEGISVTGVIKESNTNIQNILGAGIETTSKGVEQTVNILLTSGNATIDYITNITDEITNLLNSKMVRVIQTSTQKIEGFEHESFDIIDNLLSKQNSSFTETTKVMEREFVTKKDELTKRLTLFKQTMQDFLKENRNIIETTVQRVTETLKSSLASLQIEFPSLFVAVRGELEKQTNQFAPKFREDQKLVQEFIQKLFTRFEELQNSQLGQTSTIFHDGITKFLEYVQNFRKWVESRSSKVFGRKQEGFDEFTKMMDEVMNGTMNLESKVSKSVNEINNSTKLNNETIIERMQLGFDQQLKSAEVIFTGLGEAIDHIDQAFRENLVQILNKSRNQTTNALTTSLSQQIDRNDKLIGSVSASLNENSDRQHGLIESVENILLEIKTRYKQISDEIRFGYQDKLAQHSRESSEIYQASMLPLIDGIRKNIEDLKTGVANELEKSEKKLETMSRENKATTHAEIETFKMKLNAELNHLSEEAIRAMDNAVMIVFGSIDAFQGQVVNVVTRTTEHVGSAFDVLIDKRIENFTDIQTKMAASYNETVTAGYNHLLQTDDLIKHSITDLESHLDQSTNTIDQIQGTLDDNTLKVVNPLKRQLETSLHEKIEKIVSQSRETATNISKQLDTIALSLLSRLGDISANQLININSVEQEAVNSLSKTMDGLSLQLETSRQNLLENINQVLTEVTDVLPSTIQEAYSKHEDNLANERIKIGQILEQACKADEINEQLIFEALDSLNNFNDMINEKIVRLTEDTINKIDVNIEDLRTELSGHQKRALELTSETIGYVDPVHEINDILIQQIEEITIQARKDVSGVVTNQFNEIESSSTQLIHSTQSLAANVESIGKQLESVFKKADRILWTRTNELLTKSLGNAISQLINKEEPVQEQYLQAAIEAAFQVIMENTEIASKSTEAMITNLLPRISDTKTQLQNSQTATRNLIDLMDDLTSQELQETKLNQHSEQIKLLKVSLDKVITNFEETTTNLLHGSIIEPISALQNQIKKSCEVISEILLTQSKSVEEANDLLESEPSITESDQKVAINSIITQYTKNSEDLSNRLDETNQYIVDFVDQIETKKSETHTQNLQQFNKIRLILEDTNKNLMTTFYKVFDDTKEALSESSEGLKDQTNNIQNQLVNVVENRVEESKKNFKSINKKLNSAQTIIEASNKTVKDIEDLAIELGTQD